MKKICNIVIRCTPQEKQAFALLAKAEERSVSDALRLVLKAELIRRGLYLAQMNLDTHEKNV